jgi:CreA protein
MLPEHRGLPFWAFSMAGSERTKLTIWKSCLLPCIHWNPPPVIIRGIVMRAIVHSLVFLTTLVIPAAAQTRIDAISTTFRWLGPNDKIVVERYDDPKVANVPRYLSRADTGGIKGGLGFAEDPSRFSIACRAVGPISMPSGLPKSEVIGSASASLFFKASVFTAQSKLINGSPFNSISVVPVAVR